jgi:dihydrofolate reductase
MKFALIVATGSRGEIGKDNDLVWHLPEDMKFFKETTKGHIVVMGRRNWDSIPEKYRPLPGRENVVLSRSSATNAEGARVFQSLNEAYDAYHVDGENRTFFVIGGAQIYELALKHPMLNEMYITHVDGEFDADTFFPAFKNSDWNVEEIFSHPKDDRHSHGFTVKRYWRA